MGSSNDNVQDDITGYPALNQFEDNPAMHIVHPHAGNITL